MMVETPIARTVAIKLPQLPLVPKKLIRKLGVPENI